MLVRHSDNGLIWYGFSLFADHPEFHHGVFTRHGGPDGEELSMSFSGQNIPAQSLANIRRAEKVLNLPPTAFAHQTHSDRVLVVRPSDGYQPQGPGQVRENYDALVAPEPGVSLLVKVADCQAIIFYDPVTRAVALTHSGWRGSVQNIIGATVARMVDLGVDPANLKAAISPSLGPCCAEFINYKQELPESFQAFMTKNNHFDFWAISRRQLLEAGVAENHIEVAGICTKCSSDFFSYRRGDQWGRFGVMAGVI